MVDISTSIGASNLPTIHITFVSIMYLIFEQTFRVLHMYMYMYIHVIAIHQELRILCIATSQLR